MTVTLGSIGDAVLATDEHGRITHVNAVAEALTGWAAPEAIGRRFEDVFVIIHELSGAPAENPVRRALREGGITSLANHTLLVSRDGQARPIDDSAAPIRSDDGRTVGVVVVLRDITERRRIDRDRNAQARALRTGGDRRVLG